MSYEKVKSISVKGNEVFITSSCNNDDAGYKRWKFNGEPYEVLREILGGSLDINRSANGYKWGYLSDVLYKLRNAYKKRGINLRERKDILKKVMKKFLGVKKKKGKYSIQFGPSECYVTDIDRNGFSYTNAKQYRGRFDFFKAQTLVHTRDDLVIRKES